MKGMQPELGEAAKGMFCYESYGKGEYFYTSISDRAVEYPSCGGTREGTQ